MSAALPARIPSTFNGMPVEKALNVADGSTRLTLYVGPAGAWILTAYSVTDCGMGWIAESKGAPGVGVRALAQAMQEDGVVSRLVPDGQDASLLVHAKFGDAFRLLQSVKLTRVSETQAIRFAISSQSYSHAVDEQHAHGITMKLPVLLGASSGAAEKGAAAGAAPARGRNGDLCCAIAAMLGAQCGACIAKNGVSAATARAPADAPAAAAAETKTAEVKAPAPAEAKAAPAAAPAEAKAAPAAAPASVPAQEMQRDLDTLKKLVELLASAGSEPAKALRPIVNATTDAGKVGYFIELLREATLQTTSLPIDKMMAALR